MGEASDFYHLSPTDGAREIVRTSEKQRDDQFTPRIPDESYQEDPTPRVCICPRVWQCVISIPKKNVELCIYRLTLTDAIKVGLESCDVVDAETTDEHWITDEVLQKNASRVSLARAGMVVCSKELKLWIKVWQMRLRKRGDDPTIVEESALWKIESGHWNWLKRS